MSSDNEQLGEADLSRLGPEDLANLVKNASNSQLREVMGDPGVRAKVLDEIFGRMGARYQGGESTSGAIHWKILDKPGGGHDLYQTALSGGQCTVSQETTQEPRVTISLTGPEFLKLVSGNGSPTMMFFSGKLKLAGDIGFAAGLINLFDIPRA
ncbi:MAG: sterol-binding protein [Micromonosporaceae bacterium]|nr:sterol-binding protein [Micromonosporaceae bacterium]